MSEEREWQLNNSTDPDDVIFREERAAAYSLHCDRHMSDFEVCDDPRCKAIVEEEIKRGLLIMEE